MKKLKYILLLTTILLLLVGVANASEVSEKITDTNSMTGEVAIQDTYKVSNTDNNIQTNKINENNYKRIEKTTKNTETATTITNWKELQSAINSADKTKNITLTLGNGTYKTNGTIRLKNTNTILTIDGNGQTIDGNKQQVFNVQKGATLVLKNITIKNAQSECGAAIINHGTLTITQSTITKSSTSSLVGMGGAIYSSTRKSKIIGSNFTSNCADEVVQYFPTEILI